MRIITNWILFSIAIYITAYLLPGIQLTDFVTALIAAVVLGLINAIVRPLILLLTLPVNFLTLGLFTFVINALMVLLAAEFVDGLAVQGFWWALLFSLVLAVINGLLQSMFGNTKK